LSPAPGPTVKCAVRHRFDRSRRDARSGAWHLTKRAPTSDTHDADHRTSWLPLQGGSAYGSDAMEFRILGPIGVDVDEYQEVAAMDPKESPPELHIAAWPSHVLTSLVKRVDVAVYEVLRDYSGGTFTSGFRRSASPRASSTSPSAAEPSTSSARRSRTSELISSQVLSSSLRNLPRREPAAPA
jgi:hypothetical protein